MRSGAQGWPQARRAGAVVGFAVLLLALQTSNYITSQTLNSGIVMD